MRLKSISGIIVAAILATMISGCGGQASQEGDGGSRGPSGEIVLYTSEPQENANKLISAFNQEYPDVNVQLFRNGTGKLLAKIESERQAGGVQGDVFVAADAPSFEKLKQQDLLAKYTPQGVDNVPEKFRDPEGYYVGTRLISTVIAYNTDMVDSPPKSWKDLTDPKYEGKIGMPSPDYSGAAAYNTTVWSMQPSIGWDWIEQLVANDPTVVEGNGAVQQGLATGRFPTGIVIDYMVRESEDQGSPVSGVFPEEGVPAIYQPAAIFESSDNKEGAQAFIDFLISKKGQQLSVDQNYVPVREDVEGPEGAPALSEINVMDADTSKVTENLDSAKERFNKMIQQGG